MTDWKAVAARRLKRIRDLETSREYLRANIRAEVERYLGIELHARCISRADATAAEVAFLVVDAFTGKLEGK